jgi:hypothetical protein
MKNTIGDGMKMFRKYQLAIWRSIQNFYSHFTKVTHKCECFSRIVEPCTHTKINEQAQYTSQRLQCKAFLNKVSIYVLLVCLMVSNATFNNISVISWQSVLLVKEIGGTKENHRPVASH